jgi:hypothetical protein
VDNSVKLPKTNKRVARYLRWSGLAILAVWLDTYLLGVAQSWMLEWGLGMILCSICYYMSTWTDGYDSNPVLERMKSYENI